MEKKITSSFFFKARQAIRNVENTLSGPISKRMCGRLFATLSSLQKGCKEHTELQEKIVCLYGKIIDRFVDTEVKNIAKLSLQSPVDTRLLSRKIANIESYGLSRENYAVLQRVQEKIGVVSKTKTGIPVESIRNLDMIEELFELTRALVVKSKSISEIQSAYAELPEGVQTAIASHADRMGKELFSDVFTTLGALFVTAHELAERPLLNYPSEQEIFHFFSELS